MNALTTGSLIILYLLIATAIGAYIQNQTVPDFDISSSCTSSNNATTCRDVSESSFFNDVLDVSISGINGAPDYFNGFWVGIHAFLLVLAIILIVSFFVGLFFGGAS